MASRKTHLIDTAESEETACGQSRKNRTSNTERENVTCAECLDATDPMLTDQSDPVDIVPGGTCVVTTTPPEVTETLTGEALIERKRLAGAGRKQEAGTAFGSKWTDEERDELAALRQDLGRTKAAVEFVERHPHRTVKGALYQIDRFKAGATK